MTIPAIHPSQIKAICARLAAGERLDDICREGDMPTVSQIAGWIAGGNHQPVAPEALT